MQQLRTKLRNDSATSGKQRLELSNQTGVRLSYSRPIKIHQRHTTDAAAATRMRMMVYDEPSGWFESLDPEHCLSRAPLGLELLGDAGMFC